MIRGRAGNHNMHVFMNNFEEYVSCGLASGVADLAEQGMQPIATLPGYLKWENRTIEQAHNFVNFFRGFEVLFTHV